MVAGLWEYWLIRGQVEEGAIWLEDALQQAPGPPAARAAAFTGLALFTSLRGEFERGGELLAASIVIHEQADDRPGRPGPWPFLDTGEPTVVIVKVQPERSTVPCSGPGGREDRYVAAYVRLMAGMAAFSMTDRALASAHATQLSFSAGEREERATHGVSWPTA